MSKICSVCGAELDENAFLCSSCGAIGSVAEGTAAQPAIPDNDLPEGVTPLIQYQNEIIQDEETEDSTETERAFEADVYDGMHDEASAKKLSIKVVLPVLIAVLAAIAVFAFSRSDHDGGIETSTSSSYKTALTDYFSAITSGDGDKLLDTTVPDAVISAYKERAEYRIEDYAVDAENKKLQLNYSYGFGDDATISYKVISKERINDIQLTEYATIYEQAGYAYGVKTKCDISMGYVVELELSVKSESIDNSGYYANAIVLKVDNKWIVNTLHCGGIPILGRNESA